MITLKSKTSARLLQVGTTAMSADFVISDSAVDDEAIISINLADIPKVVEALLGEPYVTLSEMRNEVDSYGIELDSDELQEFAQNRIHPNGAKKALISQDLEEAQKEVARLQAELEALG